MKLKNEKEGLQLFCAEKDWIRKWWEKPFVNPLDENRIWATEGHIFIRVDNNLAGGKYDSHEQLLPELDGEECDITIPISAIEEAMKELPMIAETRIEKGDEIECPECEGTGEVTWMYEDEEGNEYEMDADCPVCEGTGRTIEEKEVPTGRMIPGDSQANCWRGNFKYRNFDDWSENDREIIAQKWLNAKELHGCNYNYYFNFGTIQDIFREEVADLAKSMGSVRYTLTVE